MQVYPLLLAVVVQQTAEQVAAQHGQQLRPRTQQRQVVRYIARYATVTDIHMGRIGVGGNKGIVQRGREIYIRTTNDGNNA